MMPTGYITNDPQRAHCWVEGAIQDRKMQLRHRGPWGLQSMEATLLRTP